MIDTKEVTPLDRMTALLEEAQKAHAQKQSKKVASEASPLEAAQAQHFSTFEFEIGVEEIGTNALKAVNTPCNNGAVDESGREEWVVIIDARKVAGDNVERFYELRDGSFLLYNVRRKTLNAVLDKDVRSWWKAHPIVK